MVSIVMSLVPKMREVSEFILPNQVSLAFITESWLKSSVCDSVIDIPGYSVLRVVQYCQIDSIGKNRSSLCSISSIWRIKNFLDNPTGSVFYLAFASH